MLKLFVHALTQELMLDNVQQSYMCNCLYAMDFSVARDSLCYFIRSCIYIISISDIYTFYSNLLYFLVFYVFTYVVYNKLLTPSSVVSCVEGESCGLWHCKRFFEGYKNPNIKHKQLLYIHILN